MAVIKSYIGLDGRITTKNPFPGTRTGGILPSLNTKNTYAAGTRENIAFNANFGNNDIYGFSRNRDIQKLTTMTAEMETTQEAPKEEKLSSGANRGAVGSLGTSSGIGIAGNAQAGLVGSVNTEVQNDDQLLPYQKL